MMTGMVSLLLLGACSLSTEDLNTPNSHLLADCPLLPELLFDDLEFSLDDLEFWTASEQEDVEFFSSSALGSVGRVRLDDRGSSSTCPVRSAPGGLLRVPCVGTRYRDVPLIYAFCSLRI